MKTIALALAPQYASAGSTLVTCLKVERTDGAIFGFTETDRPLVIDGLTYEPGFAVSDIVSTSGLEVNNLELQVVPDDPGGTVDPNELIAGRWSNAKFTIFECNHKAPGDGINVLLRGRAGDMTATRHGFTLEFRSLKQALQQSIGAATSKTCRYRLGSTGMPYGLCFVDLAPWTHTYLVTGVPSRHQVEVTAATEVDDYYGAGIALGVDGENAGYEVKIKSFASGLFTLELPFPRVINIGDTITFTAGCHKRCFEDCRDKFGNILNFGGEPDVPGADLLLADPETST